MGCHRRWGSVGGGGVGVKEMDEDCGAGRAVW